MSGQRSGGRDLRWTHGLVIAGVATLVAFGSHLAGWLHGPERLTWSWRVRLLAEPGPATEQVILVAVDQAALDWAETVMGETWPWPRQIYAYLLDMMEQGGARAVAFDLLFTEFSRYGVYDDETFAEALAGYGHAVLPVFLGQTGLDAPPWPVDVPRPPWKTVPGVTLPFPREPQATFPIDTLARRASVLGSVKADPDPDGVFRALHPARQFGDVLVPNLGLAAYLAGSRTEEGFLDRDGSTLLLGERRIPLDRSGRAILRFRGPSGTHRVLPADAVLSAAARLAEGGEPELDPSVFRDAYVFVGLTAPGLKDLRSTPVAGDYPGVEINMTFLDNLLSGDFLRPVPSALTVLLILLGTAVPVLVVMRLHNPWGKMVAIVLFLGIAPAAGMAAYAAGWVWPVVVHEAAVALGLAAVVLVQYAVEGRQKRFIKQAFRHYLSGEVIDQILADPDRLRLGGEKKELTMVFSDLEGFSGIAEQLDPTALTTLLNDYLSDMTDILLEEGGTLDKYEGDAIIAFWNAPLDQADHAARAVRASLRCQERLNRRMPDFTAAAGRPLLMRIGINTGPVVVGNMGSSQRFNYTILGDAANLASRLEGANKVFGTRILLSETTWLRLGHERSGRSLGAIRVVGRAAPVKVYEPFAPGRQPAWLADWDAAMEAVATRSWREALSRLEAIPDDPVANLYREKLTNLAEGQEQDWDGVWVLHAK